MDDKDAINSGLPSSQPAMDAEKPKSGGSAPNGSPEKPKSGGSAPNDSPEKPKSGGSAPNDSPEKPKYMLLEKVKALYTMLQPLLDRFPKSAKFTLRARIEDSVLDIIKLLVMQNYRQTDSERKQLMLDVIANMHLTGVLIQQAIIFKYISFGNYEQTFGLINEITAMAVARGKNLSGGCNENF